MVAWDLTIHVCWVPSYKRWFINSILEYISLFDIWTPYLKISRESTRPGSFMNMTYLLNQSARPVNYTLLFRCPHNGPPSPHAHEVLTTELQSSPSNMHSFSLWFFLTFVTSQFLVCSCDSVTHTHQGCLSQCQGSKWVSEYTAVPL